jgi:thiol-disulfide isomerase/thioredoxin
MRSLVLGLAAFGLLACDAGKSEGGARPTAAATASAVARRPVTLVKVEPGGEDVPTLVRRERERSPGRDVLVYVGAPWCEPCRYFHEAAAAGKLDDAFPGLVLLELDADRDGERLKAAGYRSRMIPLFALPGPDGAASGKQMEGSIKGDGAVAEITPRLRALLASR